MSKNTTAAVVVIVVIILVVLVAIFGSWLGPPGSVTYSVSNESQQQLLNYLSENRVGMAAPDIATWQKGESGSFLLGIMNQEPDTKTYYISAYLEDVIGVDATVADVADDANSWLSLDSSVSILPDEKVTTAVIIRPAADADEGIYVFRAAVRVRQPGLSTWSSGRVAPMSNVMP